MKIYLVSYVATAVVFLGIDAIWLSIMGGTLYRPLLGDLLAEKFDFIPALAFYVLYVAGIVYFPISAAVASGRWTTALIEGALFGFFAYATYDLTNQATLREWSTVVTLADLSWGTALTSGAATLGYLIGSAIVRTAIRY